MRNHNPKPTRIEVLPDYKISLEYSDGISGKVDLTHLVGKGVFRYWDDYTNFEKVHIGEDGQVAWSDQIDLCPDALYLKLTKKSPEDVFPALKAEKSYA